MRFFPHQLLLDVLAMMLVGVVLLLATVKTQGTELFGPLVSGSKFQARPRSGTSCSSISCFTTSKGQRRSLAR